MNLRKIVNEGCVIKTSGTTGTPKDIIQTPEKLKAADEIAIVSQELTPKSKVYTICKTTHAGGLLAQTLPAFRIGAEVSIEPFNAFAFCREIKKYTDKEIRFRNKPRPGNDWWGTDIKDDLKDCHALVTNYSLSAFDALFNYIPVFAEANSVMGPVTSRDISKIEKPLKPGRKTMEDWLKFVAENQFTLKEMASGEAYEILKYQNEE